MGYNMFAYCGNNPVSRKDPSGQFWLFSLIATTIITITTVAVVGYNHVSKRNSKRNSKVDENPETTTKNKIITDQDGATGQNFEYGLYPAQHNACETIALHNAKVLKGIDSSLSETMSDFQSSGAMIGYGYFGSNPYCIGDVLKYEGIEYSRVGLDELTESGVYIISYWNNGTLPTIHTVCVAFDGEVYITYNLGENGVLFSSPDTYASKYICGYYLGGK